MASVSLEAANESNAGLGARFDLAPIPDEELLARFLADREASSFEALVVRHGPRVLGVCRQILGETQDAEDAFQATFIVLLRRAGAIRERGSLGPWLHGVARRIAVRAKARAARRRASETPIEESTAVQPGDDPARLDLRPVLDEEIDRLPEKYRRPVILCYLEGLTNEEAALRLRCPTGTLKGRLTRAREILRDRLGRRGLGPALALLAIARGSEAATIPDRLIRSTVAASASAGSMAGGPEADGAVPARVAEMVDDALRGLAVEKVLYALKVSVLASVALGASMAAIRGAGLVDAVSGWVLAPAVDPIAPPPDDPITPVGDSIAQGGSCAG